MAKCLKSKMGCGWFKGKTKGLVEATNQVVIEH